MAGRPLKSGANIALAVRAREDDDGCSHPRVSHTLRAGAVQGGLRRRRELDRVVLGYRVGEKLSAHRLDLIPGANRIGLSKVQLDQLALTPLAAPPEAQP